MANTVYTVPQAADRIGVSEQRIRLLCDDMGLGRKINASLRLLTPAEVSSLKKRCTGKAGRPKSKLRKE